MTPSLHLTLTVDQLHANARAEGVADADLPVAVPETWRRLPLTGNYNFRDIGGRTTTSGAQVKRGVIWRSDHLADLTDADLATVTALGLQRVYDFRIDSERERQPSRLPSGVDVERVTVGDAGPGAAAAIEVIMDILSGKRPMPPSTFWADNYLDMLERGREAFVRLLTNLANEELLPAMFHCTGGKDRTGIASAMLLDVLGVARETVVDDFLMTNVYRTAFRIPTMRPGLEKAGVKVLDAVPILGVTRAAIESALASLDASEGGVVGYLLAGGMDPAVPARLRELLLTSS